MANFIGGLVLGLFAGANVTFIAMALLMASKDGDK
jgi:hypothetical protein